MPEFTVPRPNVDEVARQRQIVHQALIVGAGPVGLMMACELAIAGVHPVVVDALEEPSREPKANGLLGQVVRVLDHRDLLAPLTGADGPPTPNSAYFMFGGLGIDLSQLETSPLYNLPVPQRQLVAVLEERARSLGVDVRRGHELVNLSSVASPGAWDGTATATLRTNTGDVSMSVDWVIGADGAHSAVRNLAGIDFPGVYHDRMTVRTAHVALPEDCVDQTTGALTVPGYGSVLPFVPHRTDAGGFSYAPLPGLPPMITTTEWDQPDSSSPMTLAELEDSIARVLGVEHFALSEPDGPGPHVLRRMHGGNTRVASKFSQGRVFLVGDAAHVFGATGGGPGLNLGLQDAVNLGWKLGAVIRGEAAPALLDSYETERRVAIERMVVNTQAQAALIAPGSDVTGLRTIVQELLSEPEAVDRIGQLLAGSDVRYDMGTPDSHDAVGLMFADVCLETSTEGNIDHGGRSQLPGPTRVAELARTGRWLLIDLTETGSFAATAPRHPRLEVVKAKPAPDCSHVHAPGPTASLIRPDGYVAWASQQADPTPTDRESLEASLHLWLGK